MFATHDDTDQEGKLAQVALITVTVLLASFLIYLVTMGI